MKLDSATSVLITGANRGIGRALALAMAARGVHLHLQARSESTDLIEECKRAGAASVRLWKFDLGRKENIDALIENLKTEKIDVLVNNAGQLTGGLIENQSLDEIYSMFQVNVNAVVHLTRGLLPQMISQGRGKIVTNASVSAVMHFPCASTYAASKAAVLAFTNCLQLELQGTGVSTLSLITPGIKTRMFDEIEKKYAQNFEVPKDSITAEEYAVQICQSIESDAIYLNPTGATGAGLAVAKYLPWLFRRTVAMKFHR